MKKLPALLGICLVLLLPSFVFAQAAAPETVTKIEDLKQLHAYQDANLREELARLGREARVNLIVEPEVIGTFSMRIDEPVTALEAIKRIARQTHLFLAVEEKAFAVAPNTVSYGVWALNDFKPSPGAEPADEGGGLVGSLFSGMGPAVTKIDESMATYLARPETAAKRAHFYKNLYEALTKEGFTKEDALKMTLSTPYPNLLADMNTNKK